MPVDSVSSASCSAPKLPLMLSIRRIASGGRPAVSAAASMRAFSSGSFCMSM